MQSVARFSNTVSNPNDITHVQIDDSQIIIISSDPLLACSELGTTPGEVNGLRVDGQPVDYIGFL